MGSEARRGRHDGLVSYRASLLTAVPLLVTLTVALISGYAYVTTQSNIRNLAGSLFDQVADTTAERARAHLAQAPPAVDLLAALFAADEARWGDDDVARRLLSVMRANAGFAWASFSKPDGAYVAIHRTGGGALLVDESHVENGKTSLLERTVLSDDDWAPLRKNDDDRYDPRERPFFGRATAAKRRIWTDPYVFFHEGIPGITCAAPVYAKDGVLRGVVTVDFDLTLLSDFVGRLRPSEHTRVFVYTDAGVFIAHSTLHVAPTGKGALVTKDDIDDAVLRAYFAAGERPFEIEGERFLSATRTFEPDRGLLWKVGVVAPESDFMAGLERTTRFSLLAALAAVIAAVVLALVLAGRVAAPLSLLSSEMEKVGRFDLDPTESPRSVFKEIAAMYRDLGAMKRGLASFASYVPRDVVRAVLRSGEHAALGGKAKEVTVFFADLAGFTSLSERLAPADLVLLLGAYFDEMTRVISEHDGTVDKFIGDAIMAFWNAPGDDPRHAANACKAALACARRLQELKLCDPKLAELDARIGIATGDVLVGNIGSHARLNYTVIGDAVNLASRLEGLNKVYGTRILVSEATFEAAKADVVMRVIDVVRVKGSARRARVYEPIAVGPDAEQEARSRLADEALSAYLAREWPRAIEAYRALQATEPADVASRTMQERAESYAARPPPEEWDGAVVMTEK